MRTEILILVIGMMLVTYIPRALPAALVGKMKFGRRTEKFLKLIPYTAMAALIFPGIFTIDPAYPFLSLAGGAVAALLAWRKLPVIVCVLAAIGVNFLLYLVV